MLSAILAFLVGAALAAYLRRPPPELPPSRLLCPRCERGLDGHAPNCRHSTNRRRS